MDTTYYIELIKKRTTSGLSSEETSMLEEWLAGNPENQKIARGVEAAWKGAEGYKEDFQPDKAKAWNNIRAFMEENPSEKVAKDKVIQMVRPSRRKQWALAASLLVIVSMAATVWWYLGQIQDSIIVAQTNAYETREIDLPDGSKVNLRPSSTLSYPEQFKGDRRDIALDGSAYFEIEHNPEQPFTIQSPHTATTVLGTSFLITDFKTGDIATVLVNTGKVRFQPNNSEKNLVLVKGEEGIFNSQEKSLQKAKEPDFNRLAWLSGNLNFKGQPLAIVIPVLETNFGVTIKMENEKIGDCLFTANFNLNNQNLDKILEAIQMALGLEIDQEASNRYLIKGNGCD
jgi:transmembrane sensor